MSQIRDMLYVNTLEKRLGRSLTLEEIYSDEPFKVVLRNGFVEYHEIPVLKFPDELLTKIEDPNESEMSRFSNVA